MLIKIGSLAINGDFKSEIRAGGTMKARCHSGGKKERQLWWTSVVDYSLVLSQCYQTPVLSMMSECSGPLGMCSFRILGLN